jgi:hypothetical protein
MDGLASSQASLLQAMIDRLVVSYGMTCPNPAGLRQAEGIVEWWVAPDRQVEALHYVELGRAVIRPLGPSWQRWTLNLYAMGSVQNWIAATLETPDGLDADATLALADIDAVTDGLLAHAVRAGMLHLGNRQIALAAAARDDQAAHALLGHLDRELETRRAAAATSPRPEPDADLLQRWLAWPGAAPLPVAWPGAVAGDGATPTGGYRVLVEFVVNARSFDDAALALAAELDSAVKAEILYASFQPLGIAGALVERAMRDLALSTPRPHAGGLPLAAAPDPAPGGSPLLDRIGA